MDVPSWRDKNLATMKRAALWLVDQVGENGTFTKTQLREAFPDVAQIDRRMRDLRDYGWQIDTNREDADLGPSEQRFVKRGAEVWVPGKAVKAAANSPGGLTAARRREIMYKDGNYCRSCGISPGQTFEGTLDRAQLDIARRQVRKADGSVEVEMVTECNRCRVGGINVDGTKLVDDLGGVIGLITAMSDTERRVLVGWIEKDARSFSDVEQAWASYRRLPAESRSEIDRALGIVA